MLLASHNMVCRRNYPRFYENVEMIRMNSPYYSDEELIEILESEDKPKFIDINMKIRLKQHKKQHDFVKLLKLAGKYNVEWVGISCVESDTIYEYVKKIIDNDKVKICAKIESDLGCWHAVDIMNKFDGIMVDTEDLAFQLGWERAIKEKDRVYRECEKRNKPHFRLVGTIFEYKK